MSELNVGYKITPLGRYTLRGVGEDETIYQAMPRTLSDRTFEKGLNDNSVNIQEKLSVVKRKEEEESFTITAQPEQRGGITKEMSELVAQIEFALKDQDDSITELEENPLSKRKKELLSEYVRIGADISAVKERINNLKKEKNVNLRREKALKEELIGTMEQKILLEDKVRSFVQDRVEKEMTIEKTYANIQSLVDNQTELQQSLSDIRRNKVNIKFKNLVPCDNCFF
jgi:chromosome segregation ATPase